MLSCTCICTSTSSYLTLPNLQVSYIPTYCLQEPPQQESFIHSFTYSLPPFLPPGCRLGICLCLYLCVCASVRPCASVYLRVSVRVSVRVHVHTYIHTYSTHKKYISKIHIKDTCTRVSWGMWLFLILKMIFADPIDTKKPPDERPCTRPVFHNFTR